MWGSELQTEVLEQFAAWPRGVGELRITNRRRDHETTSEFRRGKREALAGRCGCGAFIEQPGHGGGPRLRCPPCVDRQQRANRAARDRGRRR